MLYCFRFLPLVALLALGADGQSPGQFLRIESISPEHKIKVVNVGHKPITGYVVQDLAAEDEWKKLVGYVLYLELQPGKSDETSISPEVTQLAQLRIAAVIFADGTHTGHVYEILCRKDAVACIFEKRRKEAEACARDLRLLASYASREQIASWRRGKQIWEERATDRGDLR